MKNIYNIYIYETAFGVLSTIDRCEDLNHYIFVDPVSGGNIWYPTTAFGGPLTASQAYIDYYSENNLTIPVISGGPMIDRCYQNFCYATSLFAPLKTFCISTVNFVLTGFDESTGRITKIVYDFDDGDVTQEVVYDFATQKSPKDVVVSHTYYPRKFQISTFTPVISVFKEDCCINTLALPISTFRCGIFDSFSDSALLDATVSNSTPDIIVTLEQQADRQLYRNMLKTLEPFSPVPTVSTLPNLVEPVPITKRRADLSSLTGIKVDINPVRPPFPGYIYESGDSIGLDPDPSLLTNVDSFISIDESLILSGDYAPYGFGTGIRVLSRPGLR